MSYVYATRSPAFLGNLSRKNKRTSRRLGWYKRAGLGDDSSGTFDISQGDILAMTSASPTFSTGTYTAPLAPPLNDIGISSPSLSTNFLAPLGIPSGTPNLANAPNLISSLASGTAQIVAGITGAPRAGTIAPPAAPGTIAGLSPTTLLLGAGAILLLAVLSGGSGGKR